MTRLSRVMALFPACVLVSAGLSIVGLAARPGLPSVAGLLFALYGLPVVAHRIHQRFFPVREGVSTVTGKDYSPWWGSHQIQAVYVALPGLEAVLRLVPGLFSAWLRLWGAEVGSGVYWTPGFEIADRGMVVIGDGAVIGHRVGVYPHVVKPCRRGLMLFVKKIRIGAGAFVGAGSHLGPGVEIEAGAWVEAGTDLYPNTKVAAGAPLRRERPGRPDRGGSGSEPPGDAGDPGSAKGSADDPGSDRDGT